MKLINIDIQSKKMINVGNVRGQNVVSKNKYRYSYTRLIFHVLEFINTYNRQYHALAKLILLLPQPKYIIHYSYKQSITK